MTSISGAGGPSPLAATWGRNRNGGGAIADAATALNLTQTDLRAELESGRTLGDVADEQGVSRDDLAAALKAGAPPRLQRAGDADEQIDQMINNPGGPEASGMARPLPAQGPPPPRPSEDETGSASALLPASQRSTLNSLSAMLGTDSDSLLSSLQNGASLASLVQQAGISKSDLATALQSASGGVSGAGDGATGVLSGSLTADQQSTLTSLSTMLGTDPDSLLSSLQNGASLANLVQRAGISKSDLASVLQNGLMFDATA